MKLIVGLGNPGKEYESSRHNIGFMVVEKLAKEIAPHSVQFSADAKHDAHTVKIGDVMLVKPMTFMNKSGASVKSLVEYYKLSSEDVWIIHDDIDLQLGKIRIRQQGASGGHNGVDSIIQALGTDKFTRFRLGTGRGKDVSDQKIDKKSHHRMVIDFVLSKFHVSEAGTFKHLIKNGVEAIRISLTDGIDKAMNRFN